MLLRSALRLRRFCLIKDLEPKAFNKNQVSNLLSFKSKKDIRANRNHSHPGLIVYNQGELEFKPYLVLKSKQNIEDYVVALVRNYFRTTYKNGVELESSLADHGLDSLDAVELALQIEDDLGYTIATETLSNFFSVKHYVNYIGQVESFKNTYDKEPLA